MDGRTEGQRKCSTRHCPLWGCCPASSHSNLQSCKAGQRISLTTYCPWATCFLSRYVHPRGNTIEWTLVNTRNQKMQSMGEIRDQHSFHQGHPIIPVYNKQQSQSVLPNYLVHHISYLISSTRRAQPANLNMEPSRLSLFFS